MDQINLDKNGVPWLSTNDIEAKAESVIEYFDPEVLRKPCQTPILKFAQKSNEEFRVGIDFEHDLGNTNQGFKIWGMYSFTPRSIRIDKSLIDNDRISFVFAHEYGHLVFHRNLIIKKKGYSDQDITDIARDLITGRKVLLTPRDWLEWQANRFASSMLMPRTTFFDALLSVQKSLGMTWNLGRVYLDDQKYSLNDYNQTILGLRSIYHVSTRNAEYRLNELGLFIDDRNRNTKHISELLMEK